MNEKNKNTSQKSDSYVVLRSGKRVSTAEYRNKEDALKEFEYWKSVVKKWDPTAKVEISIKDSRRHRVY